MQLQRLCELKTDEAIQERLGRLPPKLEDLYLELYEKLIEDAAEVDREATVHAFSWLLCAQRRLTSGEFLAALSITPQRLFKQLTTEHVLEMCSNMIVFDSTLDTFRFAHLSVREFLEKRPEYTSRVTNSLAAERCLSDLLGAVNTPGTARFLSDHGQSSISIRSSVLSPYATIYWATHAQLAGDRRNRGALNDFFLFFLSNESDPMSAFTFWTHQLRKQLEFDIRINYKLRRKLRDVERTYSTAHFLACSFDFAEIIAGQVAKGQFEADCANFEGITSLHTAVKHGSCKVISILVANPSTQVTDEVVKAAAENEEAGEEVMRLLLDRRGDDIKITDHVVKVAAENVEVGEKVMRLLLDRRGDDIKITDEVVKAAASNSSEKVMRLLLDRRGGDVKITDEVVQVAAKSEKVMKLLLDRRSDDIKITDEVVEVAAGNWNGEQTMTLLFDRRGHEVKITDNVVKAAANSYNGKIMKLLLDRRGDDIKITDEVVKAVAGNEAAGGEVMRLLLDRQGGHVRIVDEVVKAAAGNYRSGKEVIGLLLDRRVDDIKITDEVVKVAAHCGQEGVLHLLKRRFAVDISIWIPISQLYNASKTGNEKVVQRLLCLGVDPNLKDYRGRTPLWWSASIGYTSIAILLIEQGNAQLNEQDVNGRTPLHGAAINGHKTVVRLLLSKDGVDPDLVDNTGQTALAWATNQRHVDVVRILRDHLRSKSVLSTE